MNDNDVKDGTADDMAADKNGFKGDADDTGHMNDAVDSPDVANSGDGDETGRTGDVADDDEAGSAGEAGDDGDNVDPDNPADGDDDDYDAELDPAASLNRQRTPAFGEIVSRRHPVLIALVLLLALFLAVAPFLFRYQRNALHEAVAVYTNICDARESGRLTDDWLKSVSGPGLLSRSSTERADFVAGMECLAPKTHSFALRLVEGRALGPNRAYVLSVFKGADVKDVEKAGGHVANFFFPVVNDKLLIDEMPAGGK